MYDLFAEDPPAQPPPPKPVERPKNVAVVKPVIVVACDYCLVVFCVNPGEYMCPICGESGICR